MPSDCMSLNTGWPRAIELLKRDAWFRGPRSNPTAATRKLSGFLNGHGLPG